MNSVKFTDPATNKPLKSLTDNTVTYVCMPDGTPCQLAIQVEKPGFLKIEAEEQEVERIAVDPSTEVISLGPILSRPLPEHKSAISLFRARPAQPTPPKITRFQAVITDSETDPSVAATYNFQLLTPEEFEVACARTLQVRSPKGSCESADCEGKCWNCSEPCTTDRCPECNADQSDGPDAN